MEATAISVQVKEREVASFVKGWPWQKGGFTNLRVELSDNRINLTGTFRTDQDFYSAWEVCCRGTSIEARLIESRIGSNDIPPQLALGEFRAAVGGNFDSLQFMDFLREGLCIDLKKLLATLGIDLNFGLSSVSCNKYQLSINAGAASPTFSIHSVAGPSKNAIRVIAPYWGNDTWVFDDPEVKLEREPFVAGVPEMIDKLVAGIPNARSGFRLLFSEFRFPGHQAEFRWVRAEGDGNWYALADGSAEGWLCPALFRYFENAPRQIFVKAEPMTVP
jgi:hypothetical protein